MFFEGQKENFHAIFKKKIVPQRKQKQASDKFIIL